MTFIKIADKIIRELCEKEDAERILFVKKMAPSSMKILGVTNPQLKEMLKRWLPVINTLSEKSWIDVAKTLVDTQIFEAQVVAFELLWKNKKALALIGLKDIEQLGKNMDNWVTVDTLGVTISGWAWRENQITNEDVLAWLESENRWWKRLALVSTIPLNMKSRGGSGDSKRTLMICERVVSDRDDMLVKALSWALRECSKSDRDSVTAFMKKYDDKLANRVKKEVYSKLTTGKKNG